MSDRRSTENLTTEDLEKRKCFPSRKALENAVSTKQSEVECLFKGLKLMITETERVDVDSISVTKLRDLELTTHKLQLKLQELVDLFDQDRHGVIDDKDLSRENEALGRAFSLIKAIKSRQSDKSSVARSSKSGRLHPQAVPCV